MRADDLRADYQRLGELLDAEDDGAKAASLARERRMIGELLEGLESSEVASVVDQLESRRRTRSGSTGAPSRRRKSG